MNVRISSLSKIVIATLRQTFSSEDAERIFEPLIWADMSGIDGQGVVKMTGTEPLHKTQIQHEIRIERDTKISRLLDAGGNPAQLATQLATDAAIEKALEHGIGVVGIHNTFASSGALAFYAQRLAARGLVGLVMARSPASTAAFGSRAPLFGTNPLAVSFPTDEEPLVFDMATSAMTWYGLVLAKARGIAIPANVAIDEQGDVTLDPIRAMDGALLPFDGGYKGSGLGMVVELMAGPLVGAGYATLGGEWGSLVLAIDPNILVDGGAFRHHVSALRDTVRQAARRPGVEEIRLPGERARAAHRAAEASGEVTVDDFVLRELGYPT